MFCGGLDDHYIKCFKRSPEEFIGNKKKIFALQVIVF